MDKKLQSIMAKALGVKEKNITESSSMETIGTWDSLSHISLIIAIEDMTGMNFDETEIIEMTSYRKIMEIIERKGKGKKGR